MNKRTCENNPVGAQEKHPYVHRHEEIEGASVLTTPTSDIDETSRRIASKSELIEYFEEGQSIFALRRDENGL